MLIDTLEQPKTLPVRTTAKRGISLSDYYPEDTIYFYSFPAGEDSKFYNQVPTFDEELVSGRPLVCAGDRIKVITFAASSDEYVRRILSEGMDLASEDNVISLPCSINAGVTGRVRNRLIKKSLRTFLEDKKLVMAQPFLDTTLTKKFKIKPELSITLSDKSNMRRYIPQQFLAREYAVFADGQELYDHKSQLPLPCVIKVASSSAGDGVVMCHTTAHIQQAKKKFKKIQSTILVEEHVESEYNVGVQFGIPYDASAWPTIIGFNEQITTKDGGYLGGIINLQKKIPHFDEIKRVLLYEVLPRIRNLGWYGIGGIDVLIREDGSFYFIDPNFRMTAAYAYVYLAKTQQINKPLISFTGEMCATKAEFEERILPLLKGSDSVLKMVALTRQNRTFRFNAAIQFNSVKDLKSQAKRLLDMDVRSTVLTAIVYTDFDYQLT